MVKAGAHFAGMFHVCCSPVRHSVGMISPDGSVNSQEKLVHVFSVCLLGSEIQADICVISY